MIFHAKVDTLIIEIIEFKVVFCAVAISSCHGFAFINVYLSYRIEHSEISAKEKQFVRIEYKLPWLNMICMLHDVAMYNYRSLQKRIKNSHISLKMGRINRDLNKATTMTQCPRGQYADR